jgi:hypothetical protein
MVRALGLTLVIFSVVAGFATSAAAAEVLGPGQDARALELRKRVVSSLPEGTTVTSMQIQGDALELSLTSEGKNWLVSLRSPKVACPPASCRATAQGHLFGLATMPQALQTSLTAAFAKPPALLSWHTVGSKRPSSRPAVKPTLPPLKMNPALEAFRHQRTDEVIALVEPMLSEPSRAPPGALTLALASGWKSPMALDALLERFPLESRLHALVAQEARVSGDLDRAARHLARALVLTPTDGLATALAKREGWKTEAVSLGPEPELAPPAPAWPWFLGYAVLTLLAFECFRRRLHLNLAVVVLAFAVSVFVPLGASSLEEPDLTRFQTHADKEGACDVNTAGWIHGEFTLVARCQGQNHVLHLGRKDSSAKAFASSEHHQLTLRGGSSPELEAGMKSLVRSIEEREASGFRLTKPQKSDQAVLQPKNAGQEWQLRLTLALILIALWGLLVALATALRELAQAASQFERVQKRLFFAALVLFFVGQFLVGGRPIMVFEGYALTEGLAAGEIPRYGAGGLFFYGWTQWFGETDHLKLMLLNIGLGGVCVILLLGWVRRLFPDEPRRLVWAAVLVLCLPVIARSHGSESILVAPTAAILGALFFLSGTQRATHVLSVGLLGAAALSRPEMAVVALVIPLFAYRMRGARDVSPFHVAWTGLAVVVAIALWSAWESAADMGTRDALPATERGIGPIIAAMTVDGILTDIRCFPVALSLLGVWAFTRAALRRFALATWVLVLLWMGLTGVDHTSASTPRTHLPVVFMMVPLLTASWTSFIDSGSSLRRVALASLVLLGTLYSGWILHSHNNDDAEEDLWRALVTDIEDQQACVVAMGDNDPPDRGRTSRHNPEYWVSSTHPGWKVSPLSDLEEVKRTCPGKVYALLGVRCYTQIREPGEIVPEGNAMHPICADVLKEKPAKKVIEWDIQNHSQMSHPMYPAGSPLRIGVYELR